MVPLFDARNLLETLTRQVPEGRTQGLVIKLERTLEFQTCVNASWELAPTTPTIRTTWSD